MKFVFKLYVPNPLNARLSLLHFTSSNPMEIVKQFTELTDSDESSIVIEVDGLRVCHISYDKDKTMWKPVYALDWVSKDAYISFMDTHNNQGDDFGEIHNISYRMFFDTWFKDVEIFLACLMKKAEQVNCDAWWVLKYTKADGWVNAHGYERPYPNLELATADTKDMQDKYPALWQSYRIVQGERVSPGSAIEILEEEPLPAAR